MLKSQAFHREITVEPATREGGGGVVPKENSKVKY